MAIKSNFEYRGTKYDDVTFKIVRVFGSKREGWNAVFAFVVGDADFIEENFRGLITVGAAWSDENPYPVLYKNMEEILVKGGFSVEGRVMMASEMIMTPMVDAIAALREKSSIDKSPTEWITELVPAEEAPLEVKEPPNPKRKTKTKVKKDGESSSGS